MKGGVPTLRKFRGAAVFSCMGLGGTLPGRGAYHVARVYVFDFRWGSVAVGGVGMWVTGCFMELWVTLFAGRGKAALWLFHVL